MFILAVKLLCLFYFCLFLICGFDIEMLVACVDIGSFVGWSIDIERSSTNPYTNHRAPPPLAFFNTVSSEPASVGIEMHISNIDINH